MSRFSWLDIFVLCPTVDFNESYKHYSEALTILEIFYPEEEDRMAHLYPFSGRLIHFTYLLPVYIVNICSELL